MFSRKHKHEWKLVSATFSMTPGYNDEVRVMYCKNQPCNEYKTVDTHTCSNCGYMDEKTSLTLKHKS